MWGTSAGIIGVSLSEPHTSVTALRTCLCVSMLACLGIGPTIDLIFDIEILFERIQIFHEDRREACEA